MIERVELPINVRDAREGRRWFFDILGIAFGENDRAHVNGVVLALFAFPDVRPCSHVVMQIVTDDLVTTHRCLRERGADVSDIDDSNWNVIVTDPTGNRYAIYEPRA